MPNFFKLVTGYHGSQDNVYKNSVLVDIRKDWSIFNSPLYNKDFHACENKIIIG